jgi:dipeptidyl aminopeptidase/acylaminoacyl peptidase
MFLANGDVAYQSGHSYFAQNIKTNTVVELATLTFSEQPKGVKGPETYLEKENYKLINYLALQHKNAQDKEATKKALRAANDTFAPSSFYLGKGNHLVDAKLSPRGDKLIVSVTSDKSWRGENDIMPNYISLDGNIEPVKARYRVAQNRDYSETIYLLDLVKGSQTKLSYESLPGFDEDVLAAVRKENYARDGKTYKSEKKARNIHLIHDWSGIERIRWNDDGSQVAVMMEAWDNKDRWLATVDFDNGQFVNQHRLHDDAWVNYTYNEFGWLNQDKLFFLSEETGYSHIYVKPLTGKAKQMTSGRFVVNDLTMTKDGMNIYYRANQKHPGIYEIYKLDVATASSEAVTDLDGNNQYSLSPDESKLLIEHSKVTMPPELYVQDVQAAAQATRLTHTVSEEFLAMPWAAPSVVAVDSSHTEQPIYAKVYSPINNTSGEKKKAVMFTHGAGYLQNSHLGWSGYFREFMFHSMLAQQGYVVMDMDYRASKGYGRDWRTAIYRHMGKPEVQDLRDGVNWMVENAEVDAKRVGVYGGSYGGFLTFMSLFNDPELFQAGAALRPVSDWAYYNHGYTANILNTPEDDPIAYEQSSPIYFAEGLNKPLLINAPMVDDNVFFQDVVRLVQRMIELEKDDFETAIFPVEPHGFKQPSSWLDEYKRIYKLFENNL